MKWINLDLDKNKKNLTYGNVCDWLASDVNQHNSDWCLMNYFMAAVCLCAFGEINWY